MAISPRNKCLSSATIVLAHAIDRLCNGSHSPSMESTKITSDSRFDGGKATDAAFDSVDLQNVENEGGIEVLPVAKGGDGDRSGLSLEAVGGQ